MFLLARPMVMYATVADATVKVVSCHATEMCTHSCYRYERNCAVLFRGGAAMYHLSKRNVNYLFCDVSPSILIAVVFSVLVALRISAYI